MDVQGLTGAHMGVFLCAHVCLCVRHCVHVCVHACVHACMCAWASICIVYICNYCHSTASLRTNWNKYRHKWAVPYYLFNHIRNNKRITETKLSTELFFFKCGWFLYYFFQVGFFLHTGLYSLYKFLLHAPCRLCFCREFLLHAWLMENQKQTVIKSNCIILNNQLICLLFLLFHVFVWLFFSVCLFYTLSPKEKC